MTVPENDQLATQALAAGGPGSPAGPAQDQATQLTGAPMDADTGALFCPVGGVNAGATQRLDRENQRLLRSRLRVGIPSFALLLAVATVRSLFLDPDAAIVYGIAVVLLAGLGAVLLAAGGRMSLRKLRKVEVAVFAVLFLSLAANEFYLLDRALGAGDELGLVQTLNRVPGIWALMILAYAVLIPGTMKRNLVFSAIAVVTPVVVAQVVAQIHPEARDLFTTAERLEYTTFALIILLFAAALATFGAHAIDRARRSAQETSDAGMYRLLGKIGAGGMGEVWRAEHRLLARPAAIKIIRDDLLQRRPGADAAMVKTRFEREARATASLQSPHTVQLYDFGLTREGTFFYVMEYLEGLDFADLVERFGPVPPGRVIYLLRQAAESLAEAHGRGLVHRDIKPGNLHVGRLAGRHDWVKVLDFGLVKNIGAEAQGDAQLTQDGVTTGTPAYFPPEMAQGGGAADARSDVYALSAVAYWLLTGQLVFEGTGAMDMVVKHIRDTPVPPSQRVEVEIPAALEALILAGLAKQPDERPQSMTELIAALDRVEGYPAWSEEKAADWWRLHQPNEHAAQQIA